MVQLGFLIIWVVTFLGWLVVNLLIYRQLQTVSALRYDVIVWFIVQVIFGCVFFVIALVSIYTIAPLFTTSSSMSTNGFF